MISNHATYNIELPEDLTSTLEDISVFRITGVCVLVGVHTHLEFQFEYVGDVAEDSVIDVMDGIRNRLYKETAFRLVSYGERTFRVEGQYDYIV